MTEDTPNRTIISKEQKRINAEETTKFAFAKSEKDRLDRQSKTAKLREQRLAAEKQS